VPRTALGLHARGHRRDHVTDGTEETCAADELIYWRAGHSVRVLDDAELILFSPQVAHGEVMDHMLARLGG
jgi:hypothetical protein